MPACGPPCAGTFFRGDLPHHGARREGRRPRLGAEIAAARRSCRQLRLAATPTRAPPSRIFTRGKQPELRPRSQRSPSSRPACARRPDLLRVFLEIQMRAALDGRRTWRARRARAHPQSPRRSTIGAHRIRAPGGGAALRHGTAGALRGGGRARPPAPRRASKRLAEAYEILDVRADRERCRSEARLPPADEREPSGQARRRTACRSPCSKSRSRTTQAIQAAYERVREARGMRRVRGHGQLHAGTGHRAIDPVRGLRAPGRRGRGRARRRRRLIHFDVMDNHYVPNLTIGPLVCEALRKHGITAPIDVHLMVKPVDRIVPDFAEGRRHLDQLPSRGDRARRSHHRADPRARVQAGARAESRPRRSTGSTTR